MEAALRTDPWMEPFTRVPGGMLSPVCKTWDDGELAQGVISAKRLYSIHFEVKLNYFLINHYRIGVQNYRGRIAPRLSLQGSFK